MLTALSIASMGSDAFWPTTKSWKSTALWMGAAVSAIRAVSAVVQHRSLRRKYRYVILTTLLAWSARYIKQQDIRESLEKSAEKHASQAKAMRDSLIAFETLLREGKAVQEEWGALLCKFETSSIPYAKELIAILTLLKDIGCGEAMEKKIAELKQMELQLQLTCQRLEGIKLAFQKFYDP